MSQKYLDSEYIRIEFTASLLDRHNLTQQEMRANNLISQLNTVAEEDKLGNSPNKRVNKFPTITLQRRG